MLQTTKPASVTAQPMYSTWSKPK